MTRIFVTGATGYIGGDALVDIVKAHPDWEVTCLVRSQDKGAQLAAAFPKVKVVYGDLESTALIEDEAARSDIVYHFADCDHEASATAIAAGLARRESDQPGYWIHTSGTGILSYMTFREGSFGGNQQHVFNDWDGIDELTSLPDDAMHRNVDKIVLATSASHPNKIKTAIVCPPTIYGAGRGTGNTRSMQVNRAIKTFIEQKQAFSVGKSENIWHQVHVSDLSKLYLLLGEAAANGGEPATWNEKGYYFVERGSFVWGDIFQQIADELVKQGFLSSSVVTSKSTDEIAAIDPWYTYIVGTSSRGVSERAGKLLGWKSSAPELTEMIPELVRSEAKLLGLQ